MNPEQETNMLREEENELNLIDMYRVVRANWYWFLLSVAVCCAVAVLYLGWAPKIYQRTATVLIKDDTKGGGVASEAAVFEDLNMFNMKRSVDNELLVFKSKQLMKSVVKRLDLDISYSIREGLRTVELYSHSPVVVRFPEANENLEFGLTVVPVSDKEVSLSGFFSEELEEEGQVQEDQTLTVALNDTVSTPIGKVVVTPSLYYTDLYYGSEITVSKSNQDRVALDYNESLQVVLASKTATILNLSLQDVSASRAEDVLNTLIAIYNEDAISDKNQVMVNTSNFINDRLIIIEKELGNVDAEIEVFKRENQLTDIHSEAGMYLQEVRQLVKHGIKSSYIGVEDNLSFYKGKLLVNEHIKHNMTHQERFYVGYDEYQVNRPENRLVKSTLLKLHSITTSAENSKAIRQLLTSFEMVSPSTNYDKDFSQVVIDRNTKDYEMLMQWSRVFLKNKSFTTFSGTESARALMFPMEKVFEAYVAQNLKKAFSKYHWDVSAQDRGHYLFNKLNGESYRKFALRPDLVVTRDDKSVVILDTKWKSLINDRSKNYGISQADMYQMYAYSKKYATSEIWLLYPLNDAMQGQDNITFDSGDGVNVSLFFVDVARIEESMERLFLRLSDVSQRMF